MMDQDDSLTSSLQASLAREDATSFFAIADHVEYKSLTPIASRDPHHLPAGVLRIVSLVGLSAALLGPLSGCSSDTPPCSTPTPVASGTPAPTGTVPIKCTTSSGAHYLWIPSSGGWVPSDDGEHPNPGAHGTGFDDGHGGSGSGGGHAGVGGGDAGGGDGG